MRRSGSGAAALRHRVAFDAPNGEADDFGGTSEAWDEQFRRAAEFIYQSGSEAVQAARLAGRSVFKIKVRSCAATRGISTDWRMRDVRRAAEYEIREVDPVSSRAWVYLVVEGERP